jgi:uncharacterized protein (TIGR03083 family)
MQIPASKQELLELIRAEWSALDARVAPLSDEQLAAPRLAGSWSIKDVLAHITWWQLRMLRRLNNEQLPFALPGETHETTIQRINDEVYQEHSGQSPAEIKAGYYASFEHVMESLAGYSEEFLLAHREEIQGDTWDHYAEHNAAIRQGLSPEGK